MTVEEWRPVVGWEDLYEVSDHGRVRRLGKTFKCALGRTYNLKPRLLNGTTCPKGYVIFGLRYLPPGERQLMIKAHVLVLEAFVGPRPEGYDGCHNDGNATNNQLSNLRWDTKKANAQDTISHGRNPHTRRTHCPLGHALTAPNLIHAQIVKGRRQCFACSRATARIPKSDAVRHKELADRLYERLLSGEDRPSAPRVHRKGFCRSDRHEFTEANTLVHGRRSSRYCKACASEAGKLRYLAKKQASA